MRWWPAPLLPVAVLLAVLIRRVAPVIAAHLPGVLGLRDYGVLGTVHHPWSVTALSALLGSASHVLWDLFTHPGVVAAWDRLSTVSDVVGAALAVAFVLHLGRTRRLRQWHGPPPPVDRRPVRFWSIAAPLVVAVVTLLPGSSGYHVLGTRVMAVVLLALLAAGQEVHLNAVYRVPSTMRWIFRPRCRTRRSRKIRNTGLVNDPR